MKVATMEDRPREGRSPRITMADAYKMTIASFAESQRRVHPVMGMAWYGVVQWRVLRHIRAANVAGDPYGDDTRWYLPNADREKCRAA